MGRWSLKHSIKLYQFDRLDTEAVISALKSIPFDERREWIIRKNESDTWRKIEELDAFSHLVASQVEVCDEPVTEDTLVLPPDEPLLSQPAPAPFTPVNQPLSPRPAETQKSSETTQNIRHLPNASVIKTTSTKEPAPTPVLDDSKLPRLRVIIVSKTNMAFRTYTIGGTANHIRLEQEIPEGINRTECVIHLLHEASKRSAKIYARVATRNNEKSVLNFDFVDVHDELNLKKWLKTLDPAAKAA